MQKATKLKILNILLIISSLLGYLEWGKDQHILLFQAEAEIFMQLLSNAKSAVHPFTILPLFGQFVLLFTCFQKSPSKFLTIIGMCCLGLLLVFMFAIGIMSGNLKILVSTLPFIGVSIWIILLLRKK